MTGVELKYGDSITRMTQSRDSRGYMWIQCFDQKGELVACCGSFAIEDMEAYIHEVTGHFPDCQLEGSLV